MALLYRATPSRDSELCPTSRPGLKRAGRRSCTLNRAGPSKREESGRDDSSMDDNPHGKHGRVVPARDHVDVVCNSPSEFDTNDGPNQGLRLGWPPGKD